MANDMNYELVSTEWFDADAIRLPSYKVGRVSFGEGRSYLRITDGMLEEPFRLYTSLTTAINTCAPMAPQLLEWYCKHGYEEAKRQLKISQHYGTLMHMMIGDFLRNNFFDFDNIQDTVTGYVMSKGLTFPECSDWAMKLKYDVAAFIQFAYEFNIKPLGIEYVLLSERGFGTLIDLVCKITIQEPGYYGEVYKSGDRKGEPKETKQPVEKMAIINFKSGRHGFYPSNGIQAICEKQLWEENFPDTPLDMALNWSPKEWVVTPSWNLKDWTGEVEQQEIDAILSLAQLRFGNRALNKKYLSISGLAIGGRDMSGNIHQTSVYDYCKDHYSDYL